jgi:hypothetical protein
MKYGMANSGAGAVLCWPRRHKTLGSFPSAAKNEKDGLFK